MKPFPILALALAAPLAVTLSMKAARAETVTVTRADCAALAEHVPAPDVEYRPGVDVQGKPVAPADLPGGPAIALPEEVEIPITVELAPRFGIPATPDIYKGEAAIGTAKVRLKDGRAWFNGAPLTSDEQDALARLCQEALRPGGP